MRTPTGLMPALVALALASSVASCGGHSTAATTKTPAATKPLLMVSSSIVDGAHLNAALPWSARVSPAADVASVDFLIDDKTKWTEHHAPYFFNDDDNLLPAWLLGGGGHTLTIRATNAFGGTASTTSHVTVAAVPEVPAALLATFRRELTQADLEGTSSLAGYDPGPGQQPPTGIWTIRFGSDYLIALGDPSNPAGENETFQADAGDLTLAGPANWLTPPNLRGGLCEPAPVDHYHWVVRGNVLTITGGSNCPNRKALFDGRWIRQ